MKALVTTNAVAKTERVFLIGAQLEGRTSIEVQESLDELSQLAQNAKNAAIQGIVVAGEVLSRKITEV